MENQRWRLAARMCPPCMFCFHCLSHCSQCCNGPCRNPPPPPPAAPPTAWPQGPKPKTCLPCLLEFGQHEGWEARCAAAAAAARHTGNRTARAAYGCKPTGLGMLRIARRTDGGEVYRLMAAMYEDLLRDAEPLDLGEEEWGAEADEDEEEALDDEQAGLTDEQLQLLE